MKVIFYYNWNGTVEEMYKWEKEAGKNLDKVEGINVEGMYTPTIPWNRAWIINTDSLDKLFASFGERNDNIRNTDLVILT